MTRTLNSRRLTAACLCSSTLLLSACATGGAAYEPIIDGPKNAQYTEDLDDCQALAESREYLNGDVKTAAVVGAALGGLFALTRRNADTEDVLDGAAVGGLLGGGDRALKTRTERKYIVLDCMAGRGYRVLG